MRCARCGHKWHQDVPNADSDIPLEMAPGEARPARGTLDTRLALDDRQSVAAAPDFGSIPAESPAPGDASESGEDDPFAKISELMMSTTPEPIPDVFASAPPKPAPRRKGAVGLWLVLIVLLIAGAGAALYRLQDEVLARFPGLAKYYEELGVHNEVVGAGLIFRNYNSERLVQDANEVLIVRGVIANSTDQARDIPLLRLALYNNQVLLQEKIISPPQATLEAQGTVGFRITLDQPDANASRFEVTFTAAKPPAADAANKTPAADAANKAPAADAANRPPADAANKPPADAAKK